MPFMSHAIYHSTIINHHSGSEFVPEGKVRQQNVREGAKDLVIAEVALCKQTLSEALVLPRPFQTSASVPKTRDEIIMRSYREARITRIDSDLGELSNNKP
jgi:hypothetical protein